MAEQDDHASRHTPLCAQPPRGPAPLPPGLAEGRAYSIRRSMTKWVNGTVLHYAFLDREAWDWPDAQKQVVRDAFAIWKDVGIGLRFAEVTDEADGEILIGRLQDGRSWSYVGTETLRFRDADRTMNFGWDLTTSWGHATALHEIGHSIGLEHEHQNPLAGIVWDESAVYERFDRDGWDRATTYRNVIAKLAPNTIEGSRWDPTSIMHYPFEPGLLKLPHPYDTQGVGENITLSPADTAWALHWYPARGTDVQIAPLGMYELPTSPGEQADFVFKPTATRDYTMATIGPADSRIVVFEDRDGEPRHLAAADDAGTDGNVEIKGKFVAGRTYRVRVRVAHAEGGRPIALALH